MRGSRGARASSSGSDSSESPLRILTRRVVCPAGVSCGPTRGGALMTRPSSPWPKGARCAVMLTFDFDAETLWLARDPKTADLPGVMSQGRYGARVGVPRLLGLLRAEGIRATFYIPGWVAEHHTVEACAIRDAGHEIGHHGYRHDWAGRFNRACHPPVTGHPSRLLMLRRWIRFVKRHRGVWWATASEVGDHWLRHTGKR